MKTIIKEITVKSNSYNEIIDVTNVVLKKVQESGIKNGIVTLFVPHTTAAVTINENTDPDVKLDMLKGLTKISPDDPTYRHYEGNSNAHIKSSIIGVDQTVIIDDGSLVLGTWQGLYFCEFDGPRSRKLIIHIMGE